jgi:hypothetical protein
MAVGKGNKMIDHGGGATKIVDVIDANSKLTLMLPVVSTA